MRINVVGYGTVGRAQSFLLRRLNHEVFVFDPHVFPLVRCPQRDVDLTFVCTPEYAVDEVIRNLMEWRVTGLYVIKSTTSIGATEKLMKKYGVHISHNPEFLRERCPFEDVLNPARIIIGQCCKNHGEMLASLYEPLKKPVYVTDPKTSEAVKLFSNAYLSTLITFWNEVWEFSQKAGLNVYEVAELMKADGRVSPYGTATFGQPFGGKCLPANLDMLISAFQEAGLNPALFEAVREVNLKMKAQNDA
jgi:nucleotide sugar dehydrogenase